MRARLLLCSILAGCATGITRVVRPPEAPIAVKAIVVAPVRLTGMHAPAWRSFELAQRQVLEGLRICGDRLAFFGPGEVRLTRWDDDGWQGNTAVPLLGRMYVSADQALLLRSTAEHRVGTSAQRREDTSGKAKNVLSQERSWMVAVELVHPSTRHILAELKAEAVVDQFAAPTEEGEFDPDPQLTRLLESLTAEVLHIARRWEAGWPAAPDSELLLALSPALTAAQPDAAASQPDALSREIWLQARARFLSPWLKDDQAAKLAKAPLGLLVVSAPSGSAVQSGDLILSIEGQPALPEVYARTRLRGRPVPVRLGRNGNEWDGLLP